MSEIAANGKKNRAAAAVALRDMDDESFIENRELRFSFCAVCGRWRPECGDESSRLCYRCETSLGQDVE